MPKKQRLKRQKQGTRTLKFLFLAVCPVLYFLSLGPSVYLIENQKVGVGFIKLSQVFYTPLTAVNSVIRPLSLATSKYVNLFRKNSGNS